MVFLCAYTVCTLPLNSVRPGTNTDCALLELGKEKETGRGVIAWRKTRTTPNVTDGIATALQTVLNESRIDCDDILSIAIGTTASVSSSVNGSLILTGVWNEAFHQCNHRIRSEAIIQSGGLEIGCTIHCSMSSFRRFPRSSETYHAWT